MNIRELNNHSSKAGYYHTVDQGKKRLFDMQNAR